MEKKSFGLRKWKVLLSVFHVIFLVITLAGISAMYLNGGYGKGIRWIYDETYEDSNAFCSQLGIDISNIFTFITNIQCLAVIPFAFTYFTWDINIR